MAIFSKFPIKSSYYWEQNGTALVSKLIYYNAVYKIETKKPYGEKQIKKFLNKELSKLKKFFDNNIDFYKYYRSNNSFLDENFFMRGKHDIRLWLDTYYFEADHRFCTSHDYKAAKILANDLIQVYLEDQLDNSSQKKGYNSSSLNWTGSKSALTELVYALYAQGVFNNGNVDIKLIAKTFETAFNIDLGDFYHTFMELKARKINRTKFLDSLCEALIKKWTNRTVSRSYLSIYLGVFKIYIFNVIDISFNTLEFFRIKYCNIITLRI